MTSDELYTFMRVWIMSKIPGIPVIESYSDAPTPKGRYITIEEDGNWKKVGARSVGDTNGVSRIVVSDYEVMFVMWEMRSRGEGLRTLLDDLDTESTRLLFSSAGIAVMRPSTILKVPTLIDKTVYTVAHRCQLMMGVPRSTVDNVPSVLGVGISGTVSSPNGDLVVDIQVTNP